MCQVPQGLELTNPSAQPYPKGITNLADRLVRGWAGRSFETTTTWKILQKIFFKKSEYLVGHLEVIYAL